MKFRLAHLEQAGPDLYAVAPQMMTILNGMPGMVSYWDAKLRNHLANDAYVEFFGTTPEEMYGAHLRDIVGKEVYAASAPYLEGVLAGREQLFDRDVIDISGRQRHLQVSYMPDVQVGEVCGFYVLATDVTARVVAERNLQRSVDQYRALARSMPSGFVLLFDADLRYSVADGVELSAFGLARQDLEGRTLAEAFPAELAAELEPRYRAALAGESVSWEHERGRRVFRLTAGPVLPEEGPVVSGLVTALEVTEERRNEQIRDALREIATDVARQVPPDQLAKDIAKAVVDIFGVDNAAVVRYTSSQSADVLAMAPAELPTLGEKLQFRRGDASSVARVYETGEAARVNFEANGGSIAAGLTASGAKIGAAAPIRHGGTLWGAIAIASAAYDVIDERLVEQLTQFASLVELAVGNTTAWDALVAEATTDPLTGLPNRRTFDAHLLRELERGQRYGHPVSVAVVDLDHFKKVNDTHGHPVGDRVLAEFGRRARSVSREGELVARLGGEEFAWIMPETGPEAALAAGERLRLAVSRAAFEKVGTLTASVGVCTTTDAEGDLISCADEALYVAKREGRNRVARYDPAPA